jgi:hypothetical protein
MSLADNCVLFPGSSVHLPCHSQVCRLQRRRRLVHPSLLSLHLTECLSPSGSGPSGTSSAGNPKKRSKQAEEDLEEDLDEDLDEDLEEDQLDEEEVPPPKKQKKVKPALAKSKARSTRSSTARA